MAATSFRTESGVAVNGTHARSSVVAARVVFSREIRGVPVVGAGSKVTVTFLNDGAVESFRYDWPIYEQTSRTQQIVSSSEIVRRIQRVAAVGTDGYVGDKVTQNPRGGKIDHPVALNRQSQLQDLKVAITTQVCSTAMRRPQSKQAVTTMSSRSVARQI